MSEAIDSPQVQQLAFSRHSKGRSSKAEQVRKMTVQQKRTLYDDARDVDI